jgi:hypothetical protein
MLRVAWVADSLQEIVVARDASTVIGRALKFAAHAARIGNARVGRQYFLHDDLMFPTVAEIIGVLGLRSDFAENYVEVRGVRCRR